MQKTPNYILGLSAFAMLLFTAFAAPAASPDLKSFNAAGDAVTDDSDAFSKALMAAESSSQLCIPSGKYLIGSVAVPASVKLSFAAGAVLKIKPGCTLEINGEIDAPPVEIFDGPGTVSGKPLNHRIYPQWFGARGDGNTDDSKALQNAADLAFRSLGRTLFIPEGRYLFAQKIIVKCNIECSGVLVRKIRIDPKKTVFSSFTFVDWYYPTESALIQIDNDQAQVQLDEKLFYGIKADSFKIPAYVKIPLKSDSAKNIDLAEGGTLIFTTTDFFSSRLNQKGDEFYTRNDICKLVSPRGDVFPEFCFSYEKPKSAAPWDVNKTYSKGEYCMVNGELFQATFVSGPGTAYVNQYLGKVAIGPCSPEKGCKFPFQYANGKKDSITLWVKADYSVTYVPPQPPLTINGLRIEVYSGETDETSRLLCGSAVLLCSRSNVTFNRLGISGKDRFQLLSELLIVGRCVDVVFNEAHVSGATFNGLGYNILHSNVACIVYNNCTSVNCRDAIAGRHSKNMLINGGHYTRIDDHYGKNYTIRNAVINAVSTYVPGYCTPKADVSKWSFVPSRALNFDGGEITLENCRIYNCDTVLSIRGDTGDFSGTVFLKNLSINSSCDVNVLSFAPDKNFDFAHPMRPPQHIIVEDVKINAPYRLNFRSESLVPCLVTVKDCERLGNITFSRTEFTFSGCEFIDSVFSAGTGGIINLRDCIFSGQIKGPAAGSIGYARNNLARKGAAAGLPLNYVNPAIFETGIDSRNQGKKAE
ncbi:MAG: glycosyl hydrolase family 28-related protein [Victivallaceae bacterium]